MIRCLVPDLPDTNALLPWLARIDRNRWYTNNGPLVQEFEQRLRSFIAGAQRAHCVALSSGTAALELGLHALGVRAGMRVLLPALTFPATALAVERCGAEPLLADVCPKRWTLTPEIARSIVARERVDVVMPVAAFGLPLPAVEWDRFVEETAIAVLADAAGALGVQEVGARVHWAFSLHATKPMGIGEGGLFLSFDAGVVERVRRLANFGFDQFVARYGGGTNAKLSEYAAAVGLAQLERWPSLFERRREVLRWYRERLTDLEEIRMQAGADVPPATLCVRSATDASVVAQRLAAAEIETRRWYLPPLYEHPAFDRLARIGGDGRPSLPVTAALAKTLLGLPFHTRLSPADVDVIGTALLASSDRTR